MNILKAKMKPKTKMGEVDNDVEQSVTYIQPGLHHCQFPSSELTVEELNGAHPNKLVCSADNGMTTIFWDILMILLTVASN